MGLEAWFNQNKAMKYLKWWREYCERNSWSETAGGKADRWIEKVLDIKIQACKLEIDGGESDYR